MAVLPSFAELVRNREIKRPPCQVALCSTKLGCNGFTWGNLAPDDGLWTSRVGHLQRAKPVFFKPWSSDPRGSPKTFSGVLKTIHRFWSLIVGPELSFLKKYSPDGRYTRFVVPQNPE